MSTGSVFDASVSTRDLHLARGATSRAIMIFMLCVLVLPTSGAIVLPTSGRTFAPDAAAVLIDLRPSASPPIADGACAMPLATLEQRLFELPPPGEWPLSLVGSRDELAAARALLQPKGWEVSEIVSDDHDALDSLPPSTGGVQWPSSPYRPNSFLAAALDELELPHADSAGLAVDLGCGSGRDAVHIASVLAQRAPRWSVLGLDNHAAALTRGRTLAERVLSTPPSAVGRAGSARRCEFEEADLRKRGLEAVLTRRANEPLRLVHGCRWLDVPLLAQIPSLLAPGGTVLWSTFLDPPDGSEPLAPPYRRSRRLSSGQMRELLGESSGMEVLYDGEGELLTRSRWCTAQFFCARRRE